MSERKFEGILEYLCGDIAFKSERNEVREELYDHLMSIYETNLACGMTEDEAEENAVDHLGDTLALKKDIVKVHRQNPIKVFSFNLSGYSIFMGIGALFTMYFPGRFALFCAAILIFFAIFSLRAIKNINKNFRFLYYYSFCLSFELAAVFSLYIFDTRLTNILLVVYLVLFLIGYYIYHFELSKHYNNRDRIKKIMFVVIPLCLITVIAIVFGYLALNGVIYNKEYSSNIHFVWLFLIWLPHLWCVRVVQTGLKEYDSPVNIECSRAKRIIPAAIVAVIFISSGFISEYIYFTLPNDKTITLESTIEQVTERDRIKAVLEAYGVNSELMEFIPDEELLEYQDLPLPEDNPLIRENEKVKCEWHVTYNQPEGEDKYIKRWDSFDFAFPMKKEGNNITYRILQITRHTIPEEDYKEFSQYIFGEFTDASVFYEQANTSNRYYIADKTGKSITYRKPLRIITGKYTRKAGMEFKIKSDTVSIHAVNTTVEESGEHYPYSYFPVSDNIFIIKKKPILFRYRSVFEIDVMDDYYKNYKGYSTYSYRGYHKDPLLSLESEK